MRSCSNRTMSGSLRLDGLSAEPSYSSEAEQTPDQPPEVRQRRSSLARSAAEMFEVNLSNRSRNTSERHLPPPPLTLIDPTAGSERSQLLLDRLNAANASNAAPSPSSSEQAQQEPKDVPPPKAQYSGFMSFLWDELTQGYDLHNDPERYSEKRRKVYAFIQIPRELERFQFYGFMQCVDAFLYFFTLLPLRSLYAVARLLARPIRGPLCASQICDLLKVILLVLSVFSLQVIDTSVMYHLVRGQAVIKLYIFYNMLEVADKLFSSCGQDLLDALYWTATEPVSSRRYLPYLGTLPHLFMAYVYICLHTLLILFQATCLNVAFNSHNKALLTIMLSNNFVELKGSVFKKFGKPNLFQMACSDVRERFHILVLLGFVIIRNMTAVNWALEHLMEMMPDLILVCVGELLVDWFKHAFITKFNEIPFEVYRDFTTTLAYDVVKSKQLDAFSAYSDQVSRRMGFVPLPLTVLVVRIVLQTVKDWTLQHFIVLGLAFIILLNLKLLVSIVLLGRACKHVDSYEAMQQHAELLARLRKQKMSKSAPASPKLSLIEFNDVIGFAVGENKGLTLTDVLSSADMMPGGREDMNNAAIAAAKITRSRSFVQKPSPTGPAQTNYAASDCETPALDTGGAGGTCSSAASEVAAATHSPLERQASASPAKTKRQQLQSECESLAAVTAYELVDGGGGTPSADKPDKEI